MKIAAGWRWIFARMPLNQLTIAQSRSMAMWSGMSAPPR